METGVSDRYGRLSIFVAQKGTRRETAPTTKGIKGRRRLAESAKCKVR
jgi:hypothetical protein